ncbi:dna-binding response regulator, luxr family [hydrocarbon metagenome]|uniref:Dna-binding response regulator, luxr family n=1 Tax=hydrocarbon metagenome TaxID=938273 RepID=A0A0W8E893_9ZZZZ
MKIVLIEDQNLLSSTLIKGLEQNPDMEISGQSDKASDVMSLCEIHQPDIVIMDVFTKDGNGIEYTKELKQVFPEIRVLIMTGVEDERLVQAAEEAGADLFVWKNLSLDELTEFIRNAQKPYRIFPSVQRDSRKSIKFSDVDIRILGLLARGKTSREIASELFLGYGTVRLYISRMYTTTGFKSRAQLVAYALRCGLIDPDRS